MTAAPRLSDPKELAVQERAQALAARGDVVGATRLMDEYLASHDGDWGSWLYLAGLHGRLGRTAPAVAAYQACARQLEGDERYERARAALQQALRLTPGDAALTAEIARLEGLVHGLREVPPPPPEPSVPPRPAARRARSAKEITTAVVARRASSPVAVPAQPQPARRPPALEVVPPPVPEHAETTAVVARKAATGPSPEAAASAPRPSRGAVKTLRRTRSAASAAAQADAGRTMPLRAVRQVLPSAEQTFLMLPSMTDLGTDPYIAIFDILDAEKRDERLRAARPRDRVWNETTPIFRRRARR